MGSNPITSTINIPMASLKTHGLLYQNSSLDAAYKLNTPLSSLGEQGVLSFMNYVNNEILKIGKPIDIIFPNTNIKLKNVVGFNRAHNKQLDDIDRVTVPRADVAAVSIVNGKFKEVCYLTLDWFSNPSSIKQYSGVSFHADGERSGSISKHSEVIQFLREVSKNANSIANGQSIFTPVQDRNLIGRAVFGPHYKLDSQMGLNNIHMRGYGKTFSLFLAGGSYNLRFSNGIYVNDVDIKQYQSSKFQVVLSAEPFRSAKFKVDGKEYKGVRILLKPRAACKANAQEISLNK